MASLSTAYLFNQIEPQLYQPNNLINPLLEGSKPKIEDKQVPGIQPNQQLVGGFNPFEQNISQLGSFPQVGVKIKHIWNLKPPTLYHISIQPTSTSIVSTKSAGLSWDKSADFVSHWPVLIDGLITPCCWRRSRQWHPTAKKMWPIWVGPRTIAISRGP